MKGSAWPADRQRRQDVKKEKRHRLGGRLQAQDEAGALQNAQEARTAGGCKGDRTPEPPMMVYLFSPF